TRRLEACQSPVWDTALAVIALRDAGVAEDDPAVAGAPRPLGGGGITVGGDWAVRRPRVEPGGWAFEFANVNYPDIDDTAEVVLALRRVAEESAATDAPRMHFQIARATERAAQWVEGMQSSGGGWGAFDAENTHTIGRDLP